ESRSCPCRAAGIRTAHRDRARAYPGRSGRATRSRSAAPAANVRRSARRVTRVRSPATSPLRDTTPGEAPAGLAPPRADGGGRARTGRAPGLPALRVAAAEEQVSGPTRVRDRKSVV